MHKLMLDHKSVGTKYIYFITDGTAIKIGQSTDPYGRLATLQTSHHDQLTVIGIMRCHPSGKERHLHRQFVRFHKRGEWFHDCQEIREYAAKHCHYRTPTDDLKLTKRVQDFGDAV